MQPGDNIRGLILAKGGVGEMKWRGAPVTDESRDVCLRYPLRRVADALSLQQRVRAKEEADHACGHTRQDK